MNQPAAATSFEATQWDSSLEVRAPAVDADYEWLGYEAVHPLTWVPDSVAAIGAAPV